MFKKHVRKCKKGKKETTFGAIRLMKLSSLRQSLTSFLWSQSNRFHSLIYRTSSKLCFSLLSQLSIIYNLLVMNTLFSFKENVCRRQMTDTQEKEAGVWVCFGGLRAKTPGQNVVGGSMLPSPPSIQGRKPPFCFLCQK